MTQTPHDALFKATFSDPARAFEVLAHALGSELARRIDPASLVLEPGSFVDEALRERHTDLLFTAQMTGVRGASDYGILTTIVTEAEKESSMETISQWLKECGRREGLQEGERNLLTRQLRRRFGELPPAALARLAGADSATLERWAEQVVVAASLDEVFA